MDFPLLTLEDSIKSFAHRPGLIIGGATTQVMGEYRHALDVAFRQIPTPIAQAIQSTDFRDILDELRALDSIEAVKYESAIRDGIRRLTSPTEIPHLARAGWSAVISLADDVLFESDLKTHIEALASSKTVTIVDSPSVNPTERTVPVYKLLGNLSDPDPNHCVVIARSDLLLKQQSWSQMLSSCPDYLADAPLLVTGTFDDPVMISTVLSALLAMNKPRPSRLLIPKRDLVNTPPALVSLLGKFRTELIDATLREIVDAVSSLRPQRRAPTSHASPKPASAFSGVAPAFASIVSIVPSSKPNDVRLPRDLGALVDSLFRPGSIDWNPFLMDLDLRRDQNTRMKTDVDRLLDATPSSEPLSYVVRGEAGVGKTSCLKRLAVDLATDGRNVLWCKRFSSGNWIRYYKDLVAKLSEAARDSSQKPGKLVIFCDDPWSLRLDASDLMSCFEKYGDTCVFVFSFRNSDFFTGDGSANLLGRPTEQLELEFKLSSMEMDSLAAMLVRIGAAANSASATALVQETSTRNSNDILCSLWYLIPETKSQISESLRDEYCRLGESESAVTSIAQEAAATGIVARRAYEFVTVSSHLGIALPIEVLVRALNLNYDEWISMMGGGRPLWGLLYDDFDPERETVVFRTRNDVVTTILLVLLNGGPVGHVGELRLLKDLIAACKGGSTVYRNFVMDVLVRNRPKLERSFSYEDGAALFELASETLPFEDRVLELHRGIWIQHKGGTKLELAYKTMERALEMPIYPGSERDAPPEHVHTSMAATVVQMVKHGAFDRDKGIDLVREHLRKASSPTFFNAHTSHVGANMLFELASLNGSSASDEIGLSSLAAAFQEIEHALQAVGSSGRGHFKHEKSIEMLLDLQRRILSSIPNGAQLDLIAQEIFDRSSNQLGFEVAARKLFAEATQSGKGRDFNEVRESLERAHQQIQNKGLTPSVELIALRADLMIRWRVHRTGTPPDWQALKNDLRAVMSSPRYRDDVLKKFYFAVALFQCGETTESTAVFSALRRLQLSTLMPQDVRCFYLNPEGRPKQFQATPSSLHSRQWVQIPEFDLSLPARSMYSTSPNSTMHVFVGFTLNGPVAISHRPVTDQLELP
ncbi:hypothetical protein [Arenimonas sp.]|uniref:P-loop NTPase n=1 Tax=Arenimonas sp. TaxID=1872635 RepID=UPI0039E6BA39